MLNSKLHQVNKGDPFVKEKLKFFKSSRTSKSPRPEFCVEVAIGSDGIHVRDSKDYEAGPQLEFTDAEWQAFIEGVKAGEFDLPEDREQIAIRILDNAKTQAA